MAKSQLYAKARAAVSSYHETYNLLLAECNANKMKAETVATLKTKGEAVHTALAAADNHLKAVEKRIGDEKTAFGRLRNLKTVYKSSTELNAARKQARDNLDSLTELFDTCEKLAGMVERYKKAS